MTNKQFKKFKQLALQGIHLSAPIIAIGILTALILYGIFSTKQYEQSLENKISTLENKISQQEGKIEGNITEKREYLSIEKDVAELRKEQYLLHINLYVMTIQIISGIAVFGGFFFTWKSQKSSDNKADRDFQLAERRLVSERFKDAVTLLGDDKCAVRLGGIYTLHSIATEYTEDYCDETLKILAGLIQDRCSKFEKVSLLNINDLASHDAVQEEQVEAESNTRVPIDIEVCFDIIGKLTRIRKPTEDGETKIRNSKIFEISLRNIILNTLQVKYKEFYLMLDFSSASINNSDFTESIFEDARFISSNLIKNCFDFAGLRHASFREAAISKTSFKEAVLEGVNFEGTTIEHTDFDNANLSKALFKDTKFEDVSFEGAILEKTKFINVDLQGASKITMKQLESALLCNTTLPNGEICNRNCEKLKKDEEAKEIKL